MLSVLSVPATCVSWPATSVRYRVCVCVCVCEREKQTERESERGKPSDGRLIRSAKMQPRSVRVSVSGVGCLSGNRVQGAGCRVQVQG